MPLQYAFISQSIFKKDNIKIMLKIGWDAVDWIRLAQDRDYQWALVNELTKLRVQSNEGNFLTTLTTTGFSTRC